MSVDSLVYCLLFSALLALSVIDFRTYEIPVGFNLFILALGLIHGVFHYTQWLDFLIGFLCVSVFLLILYYATGGRAIGGGDVKLMAVCGLLLGWKLIIFAFLLGCIIGSVIHLIRMKVSGEGHVLAMGPYLSAGVAIAVLREMNSYSGICIFTYKRYPHFEHDFRKFFKSSASAECFRNTINTGKRKGRNMAMNNRVLSIEIGNSFTKICEMD